MPFHNVSATTAIERTTVFFVFGSLRIRSSLVGSQRARQKKKKAHCQHELSTKVCIEFGGFTFIIGSHCLPSARHVCPCVRLPCERADTFQYELIHVSHRYGARDDKDDECCNIVTPSAMCPTCRSEENRKSIRRRRLQRRHRRRHRTLRVNHGRK